MFVHSHGERANNIMKNRGTCSAKVDQDELFFNASDLENRKISRRIYKGKNIYKTINKVKFKKTAYKQYNTSEMESASHGQRKATDNEKPQVNRYDQRDDTLF